MRPGIAEKEAVSFSKPIPDFDHVASVYHWLERIVYGQEMQAARTCHLSDLKRCQYFLCVGEGDGRFLVELLKTNPEASIVCVEASSRMISLARRRIAGIRGRDEVQFQQCPIEHFVPPGQDFDVIVTNFFLDMYVCSSLENLVEMLSGFATSDAFWLVNDFTIPPSGWPRWRAIVLLKIMYHFFKYTAHLSTQTLESPTLRLTQHGWRPQSEKRFNRDFIYSCLWKK